MINYCTFEEMAVIIIIKGPFKRAQFGLLVQIVAEKPNYPRSVL